MRNVSTTLAIAPSQDGWEELPLPPISLIPPLENDYIARESFLTPSLTFDSDPFKALEERIWPLWVPPINLDLANPGICLFISGQIAERPLIASDPLLKHMQPMNEKTVAYDVTYHIQIDEETGEIFWFEPIQTSGIQEIDRLAEKFYAICDLLPAPRMIQIADNCTL